MGEAGKRMKILGLSDQTNPFVYSSEIGDKFADIDLIVGCGDLPAECLEYVVSMLDVPLVYVPGNHDPDNFNIPGGMNIDGRMVHVRGLRIIGLGGSRRYKNKGKHQYSENQMRFRMFSLLPKLFIHRMIRQARIDLLVTHSPPYGIQDAEDIAHTGFAVFRDLMDYSRARMMLHGHSHATRNLEITESIFHGCTILNVYPYRVVEIDAGIN